MNPSPTRARIGIALCVTVSLASCRSESGGGEAPPAPDPTHSPPTTGQTPQPDSALAGLTEGEVVSGFSAAAVYLNDRDVPMGARFVHQHTGFVLDLLQIESVPQAFVWVSSIPDSDRGEPHTQEHLLLGKGNVGRFVASLESMTLTRSTAFTQRVRTAYHFHTTAGLPVFFEVLEAKLNALLNPDYSDEEINREVHNYSVTEDTSGAGLRLEEGGTVYNEMVSAYERAGYRMWDAFCETMYGETHPLALSSGGLPAGIREMTPEHIRTFHRAHYRLGNMGMIGAFSAGEEVSHLLTTIDTILLRLQPEPTDPALRFYTEADLPPPAPAESRDVQFIEYPNQEPSDAVDLELAFAPERQLDSTERLLLSLFLETLASDANSNLHRRFIDSETREVDLGAASVYSGIVDWPGLPIYVGVSGIPSARVDEALVLDVRRRVLNELDAIAGWAPGSAELADFNRRARSRLVASARRLRDFVDSPPGFGIRGTGAEWVELLRQLDLDGGFRRSLTLKASHQAVEELLGGDENLWTARLSQWRLLGGEPPYPLVTMPSPALHEQLTQERTARLAAEVTRLAEAYGTDDEQGAISRFGEEYDGASAELEAVAATVPVPPFIDAPPMTLDDTLVHSVAPLGDTGISDVQSTFENMSGATVGLALDLRGMVDSDLVYLSLLPALIRQAGVIEEGTPIPYPQMVERIQNEILSLDVSISADYRTDRLELLVRGSGTNAEEARAALRWMGLALYHADWRVENAPRLRDLVSEALDGLRRTTQGREEAWVDDPAWAYRRQADSLFLATRSFMTRTHNVLRLRWLLMSAPYDAMQEVRYALAGLEEVGVGLDRPALVALLAALRDPEAPSTDTARELAVRWATMSEVARHLVDEALSDLELTLADLPDDSLSADFRTLCRQIARDLSRSPEEVLAELADLRARLLRASGARLYTVGATTTLTSLTPAIEALVAGLSADPAPSDLGSDGPSPPPFIVSRLAERLGAPVDPVFVGLVNPNTHGGVFLNSAPAADYTTTDPEALLRFLSGRMYGGGGAHSLFMKTWGAGLAYSNGVRADPATGLLRYYAERCPELPQTLRFVIDQLAAVTEDPELAEYALSQVFESRSSLRYEARAEALAADLLDGRDPETVRQFRQAMLALRDHPGLSQQLFERMSAVYGQILPGYGPPSADVQGGVFMVIGPEEQLAAYESYLRSVEGDVQLYRLYPRDFWQTGGTGN